MRKLLIVLATLGLVYAGRLAAAAEPTDPTREELYQKFRETMTNVKLVGHFTVEDEDQPPAEEEYVINSVTKLPQGDYWTVNARIKYGQRDVTVPIPLQVKWAGDTPVLTLSELTIPGLGTFSARVVIHDGKYAGTWSHGEAGGHLFGVVKPVEAEQEVAPAAP